MKPARHRAHPAAGFTVIELLVALSIMALALMVALPYLRGPATDRLRLDAAMQQLAAALRLARAAAITRETEVALLIDTDRREISSMAVPPQRFDADIAIQLTIAAPERRGAAQGGIRFFADGSSTGGEVNLRLGNSSAKICVNWLDGQTRLGAGC